MACNSKSCRESVEAVKGQSGLLPVVQPLVSVSVGIPFTKCFYFQWTESKKRLVNPSALVGAKGVSFRRH